VIPVRVPDQQMDAEALLLALEQVQPQIAHPRAAVQDDERPVIAPHFNAGRVAPELCGAASRHRNGAPRSPKANLHDLQPLRRKGRPWNKLARKSNRIAGPNRNTTRKSPDANLAGHFIPCQAKVAGKRMCYHREIRHFRTGAAPRAAPV